MPLMFYIISDLIRSVLYLTNQADNLLTIWSQYHDTNENTSFRLPCKYLVN